MPCIYFRISELNDFIDNQALIPIFIKKTPLFFLVTVQCAVEKDYQAIVEHLF